MPIQMYDTFAALNLTLKANRQLIFRHSIPSYEYETALFILCAHDVVTNGASGLKNAGLCSVFLNERSPLCVNLHTDQRSVALRLIEQPQARTTPRPDHQIHRLPGGGSQSPAAAIGRHGSDARVLMALERCFKGLGGSSGAGNHLRPYTDLIASGDRSGMNNAISAAARSAVDSLIPYWTQAEVREMGLR